ncbi:MAG: NAD(P)/FAD-dependent oxidoreductase [Acetobacteraceae bacterium]
MAPSVDPVHSDDTLPARVDVVIVGGGIVGATAALYLAKKGVAVALCEKGHIGGEQSSRNWGWCRKMKRDPREIPLAIEALRLWGEMNQEVGGETGFRVCGIGYFFADRQAMEEHGAWLEQARLYQLDSRMLGAAEAAALIPGSTKAWAGAMLTPSDGQAEPQKAAPAIAEGARKRGAHVLTDCAVRGIETNGGRVAGVVTEKGRIACGAVVLAGGAWSSLFAGSLGIRLPQLKVRSSVMRTAPLDGGPEISAAAKGWGFRKRMDGGYNIAQSGESVAEIVPDMLRFAREFMPAARLKAQKLRWRVTARTWQEIRTPRHWALDKPSPFEAVRTLDPEPYQPILDEAQKNIAEAFPVFAKARIAERWAGMIDVTPDVVPVISPVEALPGFFIATGFSGHGFGVGPGAGRLVADLVTGDGPAIDPTPFRFSRFSDGTRPEPYPLAL